MRFMDAVCFTVVVFFVCVVSAADAQEWTRFRGPNGQGVSNAASMPVRWTEGDYAWKIKLPGGGHSSPIIWGNKVFVTSADQKTSKGYLTAINVADGTIIWQKEFELSSYRVNRLNSYATGTPSVDADCVYLLWPMEESSFLVALDHGGDVVWKRDFAGVKTAHGPGNSTMVVAGSVVFVHEQRDTDGAARGQWIAVDRKTGKTRWAIDRKNTTNASYMTPCVYPEGSGRLVFNSFAHGMTGVDSADGTIVWEVESVFEKRVVSSPVIAGDILLGSSGQGGGGKALVAIKAGDTPKVAYKLEGAPAAYVPTSLYKDGLLFTYHDGGDVCCLRAATGDILWSKKPGGKFYGSPVWVAGRLYCINRQGQVVVLRASAEYELLAINDLGEMSHATPAVAGGRMFLRTFSHLACVGGKGK
ncbi:MAG: PQQ-binding-like beta-propeller repeat protein [Planctomycetes bacterium]|nr:PQQ-binding-like beta-propeller repeat protein [Planctomycetota bacterium]